MNERTGYALIVLGLLIAGGLYWARSSSAGPKNPNAGSGSGNNPAGGSSSGPCSTTICSGLGASGDGSTDPVSVEPQTQTEGAYNVSPTDQSDAFGANENDEGNEVVFA
jgi:hypothetical protein